ncbi:hypothetical protein AOQ84DRAFT_439451 [Glonium stellatum]|uniref:Uncharacterized protein n=1 Tax=Glonium stellatum TaxID=574774 RepID=A0A8E2JTL0_9PEZI|nr:hypothetical protein AOQ84DRAFT_439451 [Glonium stellatum]
MTVSTVDESVDLKIPASACREDRWRVYAQKSMIARKAWLSAKGKIYGTTMESEPESTYNRRMGLHQKLPPVLVSRRLPQREKSVMAATAIEAKKNSPIYRVFNSSVHPKLEERTDIKDSSILIWSSSLGGKNGAQILHLSSPSGKAIASHDTLSDVACSEKTLQYSPNMDVRLPCLESDFLVRNSDGLSGTLLKQPQPKTSVISLSKSNLSETKRKPISRLSKKRPLVSSSRFTSQSLRNTIQEHHPSTNNKQISTRSGDRLTRVNSRRRERQDSAASEELKIPSRASASPYAISLPTSTSDSDEESCVKTRSLSDESIRLDAFLADLPALEAELPGFDKVSRPTCIHRNRAHMSVTEFTARDSRKN